MTPVDEKELEEALQEADRAYWLCDVGNDDLEILVKAARAYSRILPHRKTIWESLSHKLDGILDCYEHAGAVGVCVDPAIYEEEKAVNEAIAAISEILKGER